jgi:hypothetical protein
MLKYQIFIKIRPVGAELFHAFRNFANTPENCTSYISKKKKSSTRNTDLEQITRHCGKLSCHALRQQKYSAAEIRGI